MYKLKNISIGYFADGPWSHRAFEKLISDDSLDIKFICPRYDSEDKTLSRYAADYGIDYIKNKNINEPEFIEVLKKYQCDIFISMSFNQIFRAEVINCPPLKTINCHAGKLPFYRGRNVLNWALINDEREFGITVHYVDEGIDTGDIILQKCYPISDDDDYGTLLERAYVKCSEILYESIKTIQRSEVRAIKQKTIHTEGFYCGKREVGDEILNWNQSSRDIFNFVRAICKPGPMAQTFRNGCLIKINRVELIKDAIVYKGVPGQVVGKSEGSFTVKTMDTVVKVVEYSSDCKVRIGDRLRNE